MPAAYRRQVQAVARDLFSPAIETQLAAFKALHELYIPGDTEDHPQGKVYDDVRQAARAQRLGSLCQRLLHLAVLAAGSPPLATAAQKRQRQELLQSVWYVLMSSCRHAELQLLQELMGSPVLEEVLAVVLTDFEWRSSGISAQELALEMLYGMCGVTAPAWLPSMLPFAAQVLELCPLSGIRIMCSALALLWRNAAQPALLALLPRIVAAVLDRRLYLERGRLGMLAALALGIAAARPGLQALRARIMGTDLSGLMDDLAATPAARGSAWDLGNVQTAMNLADHPSFKDHAQSWLVPHLIALIYWHDFPEVCSAFLTRLPELLSRRPDLVEPLVAKGLLPAMACCMASHPTALRSAEVAAVVVELAGSAPSGFGAALHESQAVKVALEATFGISTLQLLQQQPPADVNSLRALQLQHSDKRRRSARLAADGAAKAKQLGALRICSFAGCSRVEDTHVGSLKSCAACVRRTSATGATSNRRRSGGCRSSGAGASGGSSSSGSSEGRSIVAVYCGRECQMADRFAGHAACVLEPVKKVTAATVTLQQRKHLLKLLGNPDNAALLETLYTLRGLFGADITEATLVRINTPQQASMCVDWVNAGLGKQLVACLAALQQRMGKQAGYDSQSYMDKTVTLVEALMPVLANVLMVLSVNAEAENSAVDGALRLLQQQLCADGAPWLAFVLTVLGDASDDSMTFPKLTEITASITTGLLRQFEQGCTTENAMAASIRATASAAATPSALDAVVNSACHVQRLSAAAGRSGVGGPFFTLLSVLVREPEQMRHLVQLPDFSDALCFVLDLPRQTASSMELSFAWRMHANSALRLICKMTMDKNCRDVDAWGPLAARLLPLLYKMLDPPAGRAVPLEVLDGMRLPFIALFTLTHTSRDVVLEAMRNDSDWLQQHDATWAGWSPEERSRVSVIMAGLPHERARRVSDSRC